MTTLGQQETAVNLVHYKQSIPRETLIVDLSRRLEGRQTSEAIQLENSR